MHHPVLNSSSVMADPSDNELQNEVGDQKMVDEQGDEVAATECCPADYLVALARDCLRLDERDRAERAIGRLLLGAPAHEDLERGLARDALCAGLDRVGAELLSRSLRTAPAAPTVEEVATVAAALERASEEMAPALLCDWAEIVCSVQGAKAAARLLVGAAERRCIARRWSEVPALCAKASAFDPDTHDVHSLWGFGLLNCGDLLAAKTHLARSRELTPEQALPSIGEAEVLSLQGQTEDAVIAAQRAARLLGIELEASSEQLPLCEILERLDAPGASLAASCLSPVWDLSSSSPRAEPDEVGRPRIFLAVDTHFHRLLLSKILRDAGFDVLVPREGESAVEALRGVAAAPELMMAPILASETDHLEGLRELRKAAPDSVGLLGITTLDRSGLDFEALRQLGVIGLIDKSSLPEQLIFRVNSLVRPGGGRRQVRVPAFTPVDLVCGDWTGAEYAVSLSMGGIGVTSTHAIEPNDDVTVRLPLPLNGGELFELPGRVIYRRAGTTDGAEHEIGIFFYPLEPAVESRIAAEIERISGV